MLFTIAQLAGLFTAPALAAAGAACVAIPVLIHLLSRSKRKRADWGAMRFLRLAYKKQKRKLRLERWLLLATRCLIMLVAGLALAGPLLTGALGGLASGGGGGRTVHVVLDDGLGTRALAGDTTRFARLRATALELIDGLNADDTVQVWTTSPRSAALTPEPTYDHAAVRDTLEDLEPGYGSTDLAAVLTEVAVAVNAEENSGGGGPVVAVFSDFSRGHAYLERALPAELEQLGQKASLVVSRPAVGSGNVQVQGLRPRRSLALADAAGGSVSAEVTVRRFDDSTAAAQVPIRVTLRRPDGSVVSEATRTVTWAPGQTTTTLSAALPLPTALDGFAPTGGNSGGTSGEGMWTLGAELDAAGGVTDALADDNRRAAVVEVRQRLRVAVVAEPGGRSSEGGFGPAALVRAALAPEQTGTAFAVVAEDVLPSAVGEIELDNLDAALVLRPDALGVTTWSTLAEFAADGGLVWVFPPAQTSDTEWFDLMRSAFGVEWDLGEASDESSAEHAVVRRLDSDTRPPDALLLLSADWSALLGPVRVARSLPLTTAETDETWIRWAGGSESTADDAGRAFLAAAEVGEGRVLLLTTAIDPAWTNLPTKPVFPALLHDALRGVLGQSADATGVVVGDTPTLGRRWRGVSAMVAGDAEVALGDDAQGNTEALGPIVRPGVYTPRGAVEIPVARLAVNVPADAGDVRAVEPALLKAWLDALGPWEHVDGENPAAVLAAAARKSDMGWALLWVLLGLVLFEMVLARWFSHADAPQREAASGFRRTRRAGERGSITKRRAGRAALWGGALLIVGAQPQAAAAQSPLDGWLGLNEVSLSEATALGWRYALPAWAWVLIALAALGAAWWSYRRLLGPTWVRVGLAGLRGLLILLIAVLLAGPEVVRTDETVEQDVLLVLVDRSASLQVADMLALPAGRPDQITSLGPSLVSREQALRTALETQGEIFGDQSLGRDRQVTWLGFGDNAFDLSAPLGVDGVDHLGDADADATSLRSAFEEALRRAAGRPISGIVLMSDGRSPEATGSALMNRLEQLSVQVFAVPLGAEKLPLDLVLTRVDPPPAAFVNDPVPVSVVVEQTGLADESVDAVDPADVTVRLIDTETEDIVDERTLEEVGFGQTLRMEGRSSRVGEHPWAVEVVYTPSAEVGSDGDQQGELNLANNRESFSVEMIDRPIRVLYVEGYPRWEYRYLKNMLIRESSIDSSIFLLSADRAFAQEGDTPITRLPATAQEWRRYDVVILGDVPPDALSVEQRKQLHDLVAQRGAGLLLIGGPYAMPGAYGATMLADLLPMRDTEAVAVLPSATLGVAPTKLAETLSVLRLRSAGGSADDDPDWPDDLPALRWVQDLGKLKPSAEVLAQVRYAAPGNGRGASVDASGETSGGGDPLITRLRFGAGQTIYVGTDETWRWRYARGEVYFEQFWVQLVRLLGRSAATRSDERVQFSVSTRRTPRGGTVVADLTIEDASLLARDLPSVRVAVQKRGDATESVLAEFDLRPSSEQVISDSKTYTSPWLANVSGALELVVTEPALAGFELRAPLEVVAPDDERRRAEADVPRLVRLAEQTGGRVVPLDDLAQLTEPGVVRNLARKTANDVAEPIWNSALALALLVGLITLEWIGRKLIRLV